MPKESSELGELVSIDGSLTDAVLSIHWADDSLGAKKEKAPIGFDIDRSIPKKIFLTEGFGAEKHFVCRIKGNTKKTGIKLKEVMTESIVFYDAAVQTHLVFGRDCFCF